MLSASVREAQAIDKLAKVMEEVGVAPELIYAFRTTGRMLTSETYEKLPPKDRAEWDFAVLEGQVFSAFQDEE